MDGLDATFREFVPDDPLLSRYASMPDQQAVRQDPCRQWLVINHNGDVLPCCFDYNSEIVLGNAKDGVTNVWASDTVQRHLSQINRHEYYSFCDACVRTATVYRKDV